jgi:hypothetical protein
VAGRARGRTGREPAGRKDQNARKQDGNVYSGSDSGRGGALAARDDMFELSAPSSTSEWASSEGERDDIRPRRFRSPQPPPTVGGGVR